MDGNEKPAFHVGEIFYNVSKNDLGEVIGTVQVDRDKEPTTLTEQHASDKLFKLYKLRQRTKKEKDWFPIYAQTNAIKNTKRLLRLIQNEKKQSGIPLDTPEI